MKTRFFQAEMKEIEIKEGSIKIKGFASTPDIDRYNDIVNPKAFKGAIEGYMENPVILLQHNSDKPIGKTVDHKISKKGLNITVELTNDIDNVFKNIQDGILKGFSIGFIPKKWEYKSVEGKEIREIVDIDLIEVSVVSTPANASSLFTLSKSIKSFFEELKEDEYINNQNIMNKKDTNEEVVEETTDETQDEVKETEDCEKELPDTEDDAEEKDAQTEQSGDDEIEEGTNTIKPDEVENADENSAESSDEEAETSENDAEAESEAENDEAGVEKDIATMKQELVNQKEFLDTLLDTVMELANQNQEVKGIVNRMPIRKGLATLGNEKKVEDSLVKALREAREKF